MNIARKVTSTPGRCFPVQALIRTTNPDLSEQLSLTKCAKELKSRLTTDITRMKQTVRTGMEQRPSSLFSTMLCGPESAITTCAPGKASHWRQILLPHIMNFEPMLFTIQKHTFRQLICSDFSLRIKSMIKRVLSKECCPSDIISPLLWHFQEM